MRRSSLRLIITVLVITLVGAICLCQAQPQPDQQDHPNRRSYPNGYLERVCGSDTECVNLKTEDGSGNVLLDGLNFRENSVAAIEARVPSWFGPRRPVEYVYKDQILDDTKSFEYYEMVPGDAVVMRKPKTAEKEEM
eukprot:PhM_4_TR12184/c0_g1_i1/m.12843